MMRINVLAAVALFVAALGAVASGQTSLSPAERQAHAVVAEFWELHNTRNLGRAQELLAVDYVNHSAASGETPGFDGWKSFITAVWDAAPDTSYLVDEMVVQGDLVATRWRFHGNHVKDFGGLPTKDKEIGFTAIMIHRVEDGVITEGWMEFNGMAMLAQIGLLPGPPA